MIPRMGHLQGNSPLSLWTGHCPGTSIGSTTQPSISCPMEGFCFVFEGSLHRKVEQIIGHW